jgi:hypothetical protein
MRLTKNAWAVVAASIVFGMFSVASAQTQPANDLAPPQITTQRDVKLTPAEMQSKADQYLPSMDQGASGVRRQLQQARTARDVVKVLCLNDKLNQIDVAIRSARDRAGSLKIAAQQKDQDRVKHEYVVIQVLHDRVQTLVAEANQCIGEETGFVGESRVTVDIDPNIPDTDPSEFPNDTIVSQPPVLSSPTM